MWCGVVWRGGGGGEKRCVGGGVGVGVCEVTLQLSCVLLSQNDGPGVSPEAQDTTHNCGKLKTKGKECARARLRHAGARLRLKKKTNHKRMSETLFILKWSFRWTPLTFRIEHFACRFPGTSLLSGFSSPDKNSPEV